MIDKLTQVRQRIAAACEAVGRSPESVELLAVSKTFAAVDVARLASLGQRAFGENYLQEAVAKIAQVNESMQNHHSLTWHFIGPVQRNKTRLVAEHFQWVHSLDRLGVAERLAVQRPAGMAPLNVCIQVNISAEPSKAGVATEETVGLAKAVAALPGLRLRGLMAIPAPGSDAVPYLRMAGLMADLGAAGLHVDTLSLGMSHDLETAIAHGATCVRVGTALFGERIYKGHST
ncbi:MAG: YggS family pyridoxal phosphate-dependent enzyme [Burkholderiaceae bacterium]|jgi:pyridoxal phosphate enzyme (YggS family)